MYSRNHALVSAVVGLPVAFWAPAGHSPAFLWLYVVGLGVGVDVDHFLVARANRGDWTNLRWCLRDPRRVFVDQQSIFDTGDIYRDQRLLSHLLIGGCLVGLLGLFARYWAVATAVTLYAHVLADLYSDVRTRDRYLKEHPPEEYPPEE